MYYHPLPLVRFLGCSGTTVVFTNWGKTRKNRSVFEIFLCPSFLNLFSNVGAGTVSFTVIPTSIAVNVRRKKTSPAVSNQNASFRRVTNVFTLFLFVAKLWLPKKATLLSAQQVPSCLPEGCWRTLSSSSGFLLRIQYSRTLLVTWLQSRLHRLQRVTMRVARGAILLAFFATPSLASVQVSTLQVRCVKKEIFHTTATIGQHLPFRLCCIEK